ncbi:hypothetical protein IFT74_05180 [Oxalobacteraceae sp. CFBP 8755]|nr:hypothetical protein [Oxalobacteraceae sp. CFBP 8755]
MERPGTGVSRWVILSVAAVALGAYVVNFCGIPISKDPAVWGQFGDYIGGILNPIMAFGALLWLVASVKVQDSELSQTRDALRRSQTAQQEQADTSLLAARIQTLNIELSGVIGSLNHVRSKQLHLLEFQQRADGPTMYIDEHGNNMGVGAVRALLSGSIEGLQAEEERLLTEIKSLSAKFKPTVHEGYSNRH